MKASSHIILLGLVTIIYFFAIFVYVPTLPIYSESIGATATMVGLISGVYGLCQILFRIPAGMLSDKLAKKKIFVIAGMVFCVVSCTLLYLANNSLQLFLGRLFAGAAQVSWAIMIALFVSYFPPEKASKAMGIVLACHFGGQVVGNYIGGVTYEYFGQKFPFIIAIIAGVIALFLSLFIKDTHVKRTPMRFKDLLRIGKNKVVLASCTLSTIQHFILFATIYSFTPTFVKTIDFNGEQIGMIVFLFSLGSVAGSLISSTKHIANFSGRKAIVSSFIILGIVCWVTPMLRNLFVIYLLQFISGIWRGIGFSTLSATVIKSTPIAQSSTATGFFQAASAVGIFLGPIITGLFIALFNYHITYSILAAMALFASILSVKLLPLEKALT